MYKPKATSSQSSLPLFYLCSWLPASELILNQRNRACSAPILWEVLGWEGSVCVCCSIPKRESCSLLELIIISGSRESRPCIFNTLAHGKQYWGRSISPRQFFILRKERQVDRQVLECAGWPEILAITNTIDFLCTFEKTK